MCGLSLIKYHGHWIWYGKAEQISRENFNLKEYEMKYWIMGIFWCSSRFWIRLLQHVAHHIFNSETTLISHLVSSQREQALAPVPQGRFSVKNHQAHTGALALLQAHRLAAGCQSSEVPRWAGKQCLTLHACIKNLPGGQKQKPTRKTSKQTL